MKEGRRGRERLGEREMREKKVKERGEKREREG